MHPKELWRRYSAHSKPYFAGIATIFFLLALALFSVSGGTKLISKTPAIWAALTSEDKPPTAVKLPVLQDAADTWLPGEWNAHIFYNDGANPSYDSWRLTFSGREPISGQITAHDGNHLIVTGYYRSGTLVLSYAAADQSGKSYGTYYLRKAPIAGQPAENNDWIGIAVLHDCEEKSVDGKCKVSDTQKIIACDMVLSRRPTPQQSTIAHLTDKCRLPVNLNAMVELYKAASR